MAPQSHAPTPAEPCHNQSGGYLSLRHLTRVHVSGEHHITALDDANLDVNLGELVAVMGPSGSGKSTLLNLAGGLDTPTAGTVSVGRTTISSATAAQRSRLRRTSIGYVFQDLNLLPTLTAVENVMLPRELDGIAYSQAREEAHQALETVGMEAFAERFPEHMSIGQAQRVAIARALVGPRRLLLADEPTGALDSVTSEAIIEVLRAQIDRGAAGLVVTHDARIAAWADRTIFIRDGRIVDESAPASVDDLLSGAR